MINIWQAAQNGVPCFSLDTDGKIVFDVPRGFRVNQNIIQIGSGCVKHKFGAKPVHEGPVAANADLLRLGPVTVVHSGNDGGRMTFNGHCPTG